MLLLNVSVLGWQSMRDISRTLPIGPPAAFPRTVKELAPRPGSARPTTKLVLQTARLASQLSTTQLVLIGVAALAGIITGIVGHL